MVQSSVKSPNPTDVHVGARVRMRRMMIGVSQEALGVALDLTFQQIQKYEKGTNRISASRLSQLAVVLRVPVEWFFAEQPGTTTASGKVDDYTAGFLATQDGLNLCKAFMSIEDMTLRRRVVQLVKQMAEVQSNG